jgi:hypothetical protein
MRAVRHTFGGNIIGWLYPSMAGLLRAEARQVESWTGLQPTYQPHCQPPAQSLNIKYAAASSTPHMQRRC